MDKLPNQQEDSIGAKQASGPRLALLPFLATTVVLLSILLLNVWTPAVSEETAAPRPAALVEAPISALPQADHLDRRRVALGAALFRDPRLSGGGKTTCLTCHDLATNGAQVGHRTTERDVPTLFNVALNFRYGWEGRFRTLEAQALATLKNPMMSQGVPLDGIVQRLRRDAAMNAAFRAAYGRDLDLASILDSIAAFERSLVTPGSRFDRWLGGDRTALTPREKQGYGLFHKLGCAACHQGRNVGGNLFQRHGIFRPLAAPKPPVVRVPSLRNIAATAPYFHDGSAPTLEVAILRMAYAQLDRKLTRDEVDLVAAYLRTLTGTYRGKPVRTP